MKPTHAAGVAAALAASIIGGAHYVASQPDRLDRVIDGDTIVINGGTHIRLWGIDAPELDQTCKHDNKAFAGGISWNCGDAAKTYLGSMFAPKMTLKCSKKDTDSYGRTVATCSLTSPDGKTYDIARSMVAAGFAMDWPKYSHGAYAEPQKYAAEHKLGIWDGYVQNPWDYRAQHRK